MDIAWNKLVLWIIAILILVIVVLFMVNQLAPGHGGILDWFFGSAKAAQGTT